MSHKITTSKGQAIDTVSRQWFSRPDDQKFLDLTSLRNQVAVWAEESAECPVEAHQITVDHGDQEGDLRFLVNDIETTATHWSFGQVARVAKAPADYLRRLPEPLAALNLNYGLKSSVDPVMPYLRTSEDTGETVLRAITSQTYGRILDRDVVDAVMKIAGNGTGDTAWKVPGMIDWSQSTYNSEVDITKETTTLYASDRDVFLFLVDDRNPIEVGKLPNGDPDLMFRGFYVWNSEVGSRTFGMACMYLRGVCQNRCLWGVEGFQEVTFKHTAGAPERFLEQATPALQSFTQSNSLALINGVQAAKKAKVATDDEQRATFLRKLGFSATMAANIIATCETEELHKPENIWDFAQGITAMARREQLQDRRIELERVAGKLLDEVAA